MPFSVTADGAVYGLGDNAFSFFYVVNPRPGASLERLNATFDPVDFSNITNATRLGGASGSRTFVYAVDRLTPLTTTATVVGVRVYGSDNLLAAPVSRSGGIVLTASIPETSTWAMMIAGFGLVGAAIRRLHTAGRATAERT